MFQYLSRNDWWGDPQAPWNKRDVEYRICVECNGDGGVYYNDDGEEISRTDYERLSDEDKALWKFDECLECNGDGEVEVDPYEPDYDEYD